MTTPLAPHVHLLAVLHVDEISMVARLIISLIDLSSLKKVSVLAKCLPNVIIGQKLNSGIYIVQQFAWKY